jgi:signal peptidase I
MLLLAARDGAAGRRILGATGARHVVAHDTDGAAESEAERMAWQSAQSNREDYAYEDEQGEHRNFRLLLEVLETAVLTLLLFMAVRLTVQNFNVDGPSMQPTLYTNELILVNRAEYFLHPPRRGDIIVFVAPPEPSKDYVKRIIGVPGDTVQVAAEQQTINGVQHDIGVVYVNGRRIDEPYVANLDNPYEPNTWKLGPDQYFVLGDNRGDSSDSRAWGPVKRSAIIGKAALVYWPYADIHLLPDSTSVFAAVK